MKKLLAGISLLLLISCTPPPRYEVVEVEVPVTTNVYQLIPNGEGEYILFNSETGSVRHLLIGVGICIPGIEITIDDMDLTIDLEWESIEW